MVDEFDGPGSAAGIVWADLKGRLLLITPHSTEEIDTTFGLSKCVRADVVVVDAEIAEDKEFNDTLIFPKVLQSQVRGNIGTGRRNLGRLGQGAAKKGQSPPWMLEDPSDADKALAREWLKSSAAAPF